MCSTPFIKKRKQLGTGYNQFTQPLPCGVCGECVRSKVNGWLFRIKEETKVSSSCLFVTLTYSNENLPLHKSGYATLCKRDCQLFLKRLRKRYARYAAKNDIIPSPLKYYLVGEYGSRFGRPHYHIILFNLEVRKRVSDLIDDDEILIRDSWQNGIVDVSSVNIEGGAVGYVLKYLSKQRKKYTIKEPEFSLSSKRLGRSWLTPERIKFFRQHESLAFINTPDYKLALPKYFKEIIYTPEERARVTAYMQHRAERIKDLALSKHIRTRASKNVKNPEHILEIRKNNVKIAKRKREIF